MTEPSILVEVREPTQAGEARRAASLAARQLRFGEDDAGRLALVVTEAATNLHKHAGGGEIVLTPAVFGPPGVEVLALDKGPGLPDVQQSLEDGYSTAGSHGIGLGAIERQADDFDIYTRADLGTVLWARVNRSRVPGSGEGPFEVSGVNVPLHTERVSGDGWATAPAGEGLLVIVSDGLGHGPDAAKATAEALGSFEEHRNLELPGMLAEANEALRQTRGAAIALARIDPGAQTLGFAGVGNIRGFVVTRGGRRDLTSHDGTVGLFPRVVREYRYDWSQDSVLVMASDGLLSRMDLSLYPGLSLRRPGVIAGALARDNRRGNDDACVVVVRQASRRS